jgi:PAS domain S-box-containing protein
MNTKSNNMDSRDKLNTETQSQAQSPLQTTGRSGDKNENVTEALKAPAMDFHNSPGIVNESQLNAETLLLNIPVPIILLNNSLKVLFANNFFYKKFDVTEKEIKGHSVYELGNGQWNNPALHQLLKEVIPKNEAFENFPVEYFFNTLGHKVMQLSGRRIQSGNQQLILMTFADVTSMHILATEKEQTEKKVLQDKVEEEKKESELFRFIADAMPQKIWTADENGKRNYFNKQWIEYSGMSLKELEIEWENIIHPDDLPLTNKLWNQSLKSGKNFEAEVRKRDKDGNYKWHLSRATPFRDKNGKITLWIGTNTEFEKHKIKSLQLEEIADKRQVQLTEEKEFSETIINTTLDLIAVYDTEMRIIEFNKACEDLYGVKKAEVLGKTLREVFPSAIGTQAEKDLERSLMGETIHNQVLQSPLSGRHYENFLTPLKNAAGEIYSILVIAHDIEDSIKAIESLKESEEKFIKLFESSPFSISLTDNDTGKILDVNEHYLEMTGFTRNEVIGRTSLELNMIKEDLRDKIYTILLQDGSIKNAEVEIKIKSGERIPVLVSTETISIGQKNYLLHALNDISERKKTEKEIEQKNKDLEIMNHELEAFTYISSHDLQEPLRKIQTFAGRLLEKENKNLSDQGKEYLHRMQVAANKMQMFILDLLAFSRVTTSERKFVLTDLGGIIREVQSEFKDAIIAKNATINTGAMCDVNIIPFQFRQLMQNLISNALKFSKPGTPPVVTILSEKIPANTSPLNGKPAWHISFSDNGIGFDQHYSEKMFQLFQRLHGKNEYEGTGIGLSIIKKIIENHHGIITATGKPSQGARFDMYIPA